VLTVTGSSSLDRATRSLAPAEGVTPAPAEGTTYRFLSDVILARGLVEPTTMKAALQASLAGRSLTEILVDNGQLGEDDLARTLAEHHHLDHVDLEVFAVDAAATGLIEPDVALRFGAVPIALLASGAVVVALHDPNGSTAALEFARLTGRVIQPAVASRSQIEALIASLRRGGHAPPAPADRSDAAPPETHLRSMPAGSIVVPPSWESGGALPGSADAGHVAAVRQRAETAERRCREAEARAREAEELCVLAEARARATAERTLAAGDRAGATEERAGEASSDANVARLLHACEVLEREARTRSPQVEALRAALDVEHAQRIQLELALRHPAPADRLMVLEARVAELERRLEDRTRATAAPDPTAEPDPPSPHDPAAEAEPPSPYDPAAEPDPPAPHDAAAEPDLAAPHDAAAEPEPPSPYDAAVLDTEPAADPSAEADDVPYVPALAPMPSADSAPASAPQKARRRGLFRMRKRSS
jgi:hypothetical protein